jgi:hypothetical protein
MSYEPEKVWTVWVGGVEVNDYLLTFEKATELSMQYVTDGHTDVCIQRLEN